ncbi:hypothetical protein JCM1840_001793 [Sporobolomyces johnsonii]
MAEPLTYHDSPFADYLRETDTHEEPLLDPAPPAPSTSSEPHPPRSRTTLSPPATPSPHAERLKYALGTSALLSAQLSDALELYPPLAALTQQATVEGAQERKGKSKLEWPAGWDTRGQGWLDRDALGNAHAALKGLVAVVQRLSGGSGPSSGVAPVLSAPAPPSSRAGKGGKKDDGALKEVELFIRAAQELDLRIAKAMEALKVLDGIEDRLAPEQLGYSYSASPPRPLPRSSPPQPQRTARIPPSTFPDSPSPSPYRHTRLPPSPPNPLRLALSSTLSTLLHTLQSTTTQLEALLPPPSSPSPHPAFSPSSSQRQREKHRPLPSLSELNRHASLALQERAEIEKWETESATSGHSRAGSMQLDSARATAAPAPAAAAGAVDPFHPTESFFGGLERRPSNRSLSNYSSTPGGAGGGGGDATVKASTGRHRVRPSLGAVGAFGVGTAAGTGTGGASPLLREVSLKGGRRRPASMGGWIGAGELTPLELASLPGQDVELLEGGAALQEQWEDAHVLRRGVVWALIEVAETQGSGWEEAGRVVSELARKLRELAAGLRDAKGCEMAAGVDKDRRRRSRPASYYAAASLSTYPTSTSTSVLPASPIQSALARLNGVPLPGPSPSFESRGPNRPTHQPNFGPPSTADSPSTQALRALEAHHTALSLSLRQLQHKLHSILLEAKALSLSASGAPVEQLLTAHDSIREDLHALAEEWAQSRVVLRQALGVELKKPAKPAGFGLGLDADEPAGDAVSDELEPMDAPPEEEGAEFASLDEGEDDALLGPAGLAERQALVDAALSLSLAPPPGSESAEEKVFEAVAGQRDDGQKGEGGKLSREERIKRMREAREALAAGRAAAGGDAGMGQGGGQGAVEVQQRMVGELREVLRGLGRGRDGVGEGVAKVNKLDGGIIP